MMANPKALTGSNTSLVRSHNLRAILLLLLRHELASRAYIAEQTGLSSTTVTNLVAELIQHGVVAEHGTEIPWRRRSVGRPRTALCLVPEARYALGVHIGVGNVRVALVNLRAQPITSLTLDHSLDCTPQEVLADTATLVEQVLDQSAIGRQGLVGIGVGASGLVDPQTGFNVFAPNLGWHDVPIQDLLSQHFSLPVFVDNNVRAMALGESLFGAGQETHALAFVYARVGVGAGFVVDGQIYRGSGAGAGEIGHATIVADRGDPCRCGNTGCLETLVSEPIFVQKAEEIAVRHPDGLLARHLRQAECTPIEGIFSAGRAGDPETLTMLQQRARYMGIALANLVNILNPELILLGGLFHQGQDLLLPPTEATMRRRAFAGLGQRVQLKTTSFGRQAGVIGAAALALDAFFYRQGAIA